MLALAACCTTQNNLQAQESHKKFTLTNGRVWWMDATVCDQTKKYPVAYDHQNGWAVGVSTVGKPIVWISTTSSLTAYSVQPEIDKKYK